MFNGSVHILTLCLAITLFTGMFPVDAWRARASLQNYAKNPDRRYDRDALLRQFENILKTSIPAYAQFPSSGFFVYDLNDPTNKYIPSIYVQADSGIRFLENHFYHFSTAELSNSQSHIAALEDGKVKVFKSINCKNSLDRLSDVIGYAEKTLRSDQTKKEILTRIKNYRRYGFYMTTDSYNVESCSPVEEIPENPNKQYDRWKVLEELSETLRSSVSESVLQYYSRYFVEDARANGFFVYDLTEPSNKQTSLLERVDFKDDHVYHFAYIDLPFSFSHIAILEQGKLKVFRAINCERGPDTLEDVIQYLSQKLKNARNKSLVLQRVKAYRKYGVYASFAGSSEPRCNEMRVNARPQGPEM